MKNFIWILVAVFAGSSNEAPSARAPKCRNPKGKVGSSIIEGCMKKICTGKGKKAYWKESYDSVRCCQIFVVPPGPTTSVVVCDGTLHVKEVNNTDTVDLNQSTITCQTPTNITNFMVGSASPGCTDLNFTISFVSIGNMTILTNASVTPDPASLPCPLIGFDIFCIGSGLPGQTLQPFSFICDNDCNNKVKSWEECASRCFGVYGNRDPIKGEAPLFWSFQSGFGPNKDNFNGNCCCKNRRGPMIRSAGSVMGSIKCLGAGSLA